MADMDTETACPGKGKQFQDQEDLSDKVQRHVPVAICFAISGAYHSKYYHPLPDTPKKEERSSPWT